MTLACHWGVSTNLRDSQSPNKHSRNRLNLICFIQYEINASWDDQHRFQREYNKGNKRQIKNFRIAIQKKNSINLMYCSNKLFCCLLMCFVCCFCFWLGLVWGGCSLGGEFFVWFYFVFWVFLLCFWSESQVAQVGLKLSLWLRLTMNSWSSCLYLPR